MLDILQFLAAPFAACLVLVAILGYFGIHVLLRQVIFVDLALAQIAALGSVVALLAGHEPGSLGSFGYSLAATTLGAAIFSLTRMRHEKIPHEAIIGISFVIASAAAILVADRTPEGAEHIKEMLAGSILWITWAQVGRVLAVCLVVGLFHFLLRRRFLGISEDPEHAFDSGVAVRWWDFLFYLSFGLVITLSVEIAGVLMVFAYLVAPAIIALTLGSAWRARLAVAWCVGFIGSFLGLLASYRWDTPSGPAIVCALGLLLVAFGTSRVLRARA